MGCQGRCGQIQPPTSKVQDALHPRYFVDDAVLGASNPSFSAALMEVSSSGLSEASARHCRTRCSASRFRQHKALRGLSRRPPPSMQAGSRQDSPVQRSLGQAVPLCLCLLVGCLPCELLGIRCACLDKSSFRSADGECPAQARAFQQSQQGMLNSNPELPAARDVSGAWVSGCPAAAWTAWSCKHRCARLAVHLG